MERLLRRTESPCMISPTLKKSITPTASVGRPMANAPPVAMVIRKFSSKTRPRTTPRTRRRQERSSRPQHMRRRTARHPATARHGAADARARSSDCRGQQAQTGGQQCHLPAQREVTLARGGS